MPTASPASAETRSKISTTSICCKTWANIPFCPTTPPILSAPSSHVRPTHQETLPIASTLPITIGPTPTTCARQRNFFLVFFFFLVVFFWLRPQSKGGRGRSRWSRMLLSNYESSPGVRAFVLALRSLMITPSSSQLLFARHHQSQPIGRGTGPTRHIKGGKEERNRKKHR